MEMHPCPGPVLFAAWLPVPIPMPMPVPSCSRISNPAPGRVPGCWLVRDHQGERTRARGSLPVDRSRRWHVWCSYLVFGLLVIPSQSRAKPHRPGYKRGQGSRVQARVGPTRSTLKADTHQRLPCAVLLLPTTISAATPALPCMVHGIAPHPWPQPGRVACQLSSRSQTLPHWSPSPSPSQAENNLGIMACGLP